MEQFYQLRNGGVLPKPYWAHQHEKAEPGTCILAPHSVKYVFSFLSIDFNGLCTSLMGDVAPDILYASNLDITQSTLNLCTTCATQIATHKVLPYVL